MRSPSVGTGEVWRFADKLRDDIQLRVQRRDSESLGRRMQRLDGPGPGPGRGAGRIFRDVVREDVTSKQ